MNRRYLFLATITLALLVALAACVAPAAPAAPATATTPDATQPTPTADPTGEAAVTPPTEAAATPESTDAITATAATGYPVTIVHEGGETTLTTTPQRVVVLEYSYVDALFVLGVQPVGYADDGVPAYLLTLLADTEAVPVGTRNEPNLETISALQPDLIIADLTRHSTSYDVLNQIAPTVMYDSYRGSFENQIAILESMSQIFQAQAAAQVAIDEAYASLAAAQELVKGHERKIAVGVLASTGFTAHSNESFKGSLLGYLGLPTELTLQDGATQFLVDLEAIAQLEPEAIVVTCAPEDRGLWEEWESQPVWQQLDAVQNQHIYVFNRDLWSKSRGLISLQLILRDARDSGLLTGDPSSYTTCPDPVES